MPGKDVLVFDLNETLLDMSGLDGEFVHLFDDAGVRKTWFQQVVELFMSATIVGIIGVSTRSRTTRWSWWPASVVPGLRLVAAHGWDIAGALNAGCKAAFVARPGKVLAPAARQPDIFVKDLRELAERLSGP